MGYLEAKSNKKLVIEFSEKLEKFHSIEVKTIKSLPGNSLGYGGPSGLQKRVRKKASEIDENYAGLRDYLSQNMERLKSIARKHSISVEMHSYPASMIGSRIIPINVFDSVLENNSHGDIDFQTVHDKMQAVIGACNEHERSEFSALVNPFHWFKEFLFSTLRIPFTLIKATGFDVGKIENNVFGHIARAVILIFVIWVLMNWLGFSKEDLIGIKESLPK